MRLRWLFLSILAVYPALPAQAASLQFKALDQSVPINFNILPGNQQPGHPVVRAFNLTLRQGTSLNDQVMIVNPSRTQSLTVRLSVSDALTRPQGGGLAFNDSARQQRLGRWLRLAATTVTVPPYHLSYVPMTLTLPSWVRPGEFEGSVNATDLQPQTMLAGQMHVHVYLNRRCIVLLRVAGQATAGMQVRQVHIVRGGAHGVLIFTLRNTGTVLAYPTSVTISLTGRTASTLHAAAGVVLGGDGTTLAYPLQQPLVGSAYRVHIAVSYLAAVSNTALRHFGSQWGGVLAVPARLGG